METGNLIIDATYAFERERRRHRRERTTAWLLRRRGRGLKCLDAALGQAAPGLRRGLGVRPIPIDSIVGTAEPEKIRAFGDDFRPPASSRRRWEGIWVAGRRGAALPPISVYRVHNKHFVADGHHRVSVARALGMAAIDAEVTELAGYDPGR